MFSCTTSFYSTTDIISTFESVYIILLDNHISSILLLMLVLILIEVLQLLFNISIDKRLIFWSKVAK